MEKWVLASDNQGKLQEYNHLLASENRYLVAQGTLGIQTPPETGLTFVENALIKARHAAEKTHLPALAEDAGLVVPALKGAPGLYSSRYAGDDATDAQNVAKLLRDMAQIDNRRAFFVSVIVFMRHAKDPAPIIAEGRWWGEVASSARGEGGFGYDPVFWLTDLQKTAAQLSREEKNALSHRGQAIRSLLAQLKNA